MNLTSESARHALVGTAMKVDGEAVESLAVSSKTEGCEDRVLAAALYALWANGCYDDEGMDKRCEDELLTRIGRYILAEDSQGFIGYREYAGERSAELYFGDMIR